jgi:O-antigen/teichoic acid export membrane protein
MILDRFFKLPISVLSSKGARTKNVIKGSFSMLGSALIGNLTRLGLVMILSRYYSKEEFGIWAAITSTASVIAYGDFGIINALRNKLSKLIVLGNRTGPGKKVLLFFFYLLYLFQLPDFRISCCN